MSRNQETEMQPFTRAARRARLYPLLAMLAVTACTREESAPLDLGQAFQWNLQGLLSKDSNVRYRAFDMCRRNWQFVRQYLRGLADSTELPKRMAGAYLVARLGTEQDLPMLHSFLADASFEVRRMAIGGVVRLDDAASVPALVKFLDHAKYQEVRMILDTINRIDPEAGEAACEQRAADERWAHRRAAAEALGMLASQSSASVLESLLEDPAWLVQAEAAKAVGRRRDQGGHAGLLGLLTSDQEPVRSAAVRALASLSNAEDLAVFRKLIFADDDKHVRIAAIESLPSFARDQATALISAVLKKKKLPRKIYKAAFRSLLAMGAGKPAELFQAVLNGDNKKMAKLARAIQNKDAISASQKGEATPGKD